jgi:hypothetical protein
MAKPAKVSKCPKHPDVTLSCPACLSEERGGKVAETANAHMAPDDRTARAIKAAKTRWKHQRN